MPVNSRDAKFGAAIGFIVIVGIVAIYFDFSAKLVLALLAGLGILSCASLVEGYVRAAMLGAGAILLLLVVYDLATSCDGACQQARVEAAQQRAAQEQARPTALRPPTDPICNWGVEPIILGQDWVPLRGDRCQVELSYEPSNKQLYVKTSTSDLIQGPYHHGDPFPHGVVAVMNKGTPVKATVKNKPAVYR